MSQVPVVIPDQQSSLMGDIPQWLQLVLATLVGIVSASAFSIRGLWRMSDRIRDLEAKVGSAPIAEQIAKDRHDVIYPMVQAQFVLPLDRLEAEVKAQGQNIAILLDRDRLDHKLAEIMAVIGNRKES